MKLSRRTIAKVETWLDKQKTPKLRKMLVEDWVEAYEPRDIEEMKDEDVRETMLRDIKEAGKSSGPGPYEVDQIEAILENIGIDVEYSDDDGGDDDFDDDEEE